MVDKELINELVKQGNSYQEIADIIGVSRQRIFQISKNYHNFGYDKRKKLYRNFGLCSICNKNRSVTLHHKDFNNANDIIENMQPLCSKCHVKIHLDRRNTYKKFIRKDTYENRPLKIPTEEEKKESKRKFLIPIIERLTNIE